MRSSQRPVGLPAVTTSTRASLGLKSVRDGGERGSFGLSNVFERARLSAEWLFTLLCRWECTFRLYEICIRTGSAVARPKQHYLAYIYCARIVEGNSIDMLHYALERGLEPTEGALVTAVSAGKIDFVEVLLEEGCSMNKYTAWYACDIGRLDILQLLFEWGAEWDASATHVAAEKGYLDILVYLHENGYPWNAKTTQSASRAGQLCTLRYLLENDCPIREDILCNTVQCTSEGCMQCLRYLYEEWLLPEEGHYVTLWAAFAVVFARFRMAFRSRRLSV